MIEKPIGVEPIPEWEHLRFLEVEIGDLGSWTIHIWTRKYEERLTWKCTISPKRPFNFQEGYDSEYDAVNGWMHVGDES